MAVVGWDIGGVNTKATLVVGGVLRGSGIRAFELQCDPDQLATILRSLARALGAGDGLAARHAVTMTAELSQMFRTKREGVAFVLGAVERAFPGAALAVFTVDGRFVDAREARATPLLVAAANWAATAHMVARMHATTLLVDIGTTTADIVPIVAGAVAAEGRTDPGRLACGELVYTGALRTPVEAIVQQVPCRGGTCPVSAEGFALAGDVHVWRGDLDAADYSVAAPDGRPPTREFAGERLARVVCGDREILDEAAMSAIADAVAAAQITQVATAIRRVRARVPLIDTAVVTGLGAFIAERAAIDAGLTTIRLADAWGRDAARCAPAAAVALLLDARQIPNPKPQIPNPNTDDRFSRSAGASALATTPPGRSPVDVVVKVGGSLLAHAGHLDAVLDAIALASHGRFVLVVPGGGPFADVVRSVDRDRGLTDSAAHWMALLAMDQYAELLAARLPRAEVVFDVEQAGVAHHSGRVPVLAPSRWLRRADPLPHSWDVTSDSIAAWCAGAMGASQLVLVKAPGARGGELVSDLVDAHFAAALPATVTVAIAAADEILRLRDLLCSPVGQPS